MAIRRPLKVSRDILAKFLPDFDTIRQFEKLIQSIDEFEELVDDRVAELIQDGTGLTWTYDDVNDTLTGDVSLAPFDTDDLSEGSTNLYFTTARAQAVIDADTTLLKTDGSRNATGTQQFENVTRTGFEQSSTHFVSTTATVLAGTVFCTGSGYTLTMPAHSAGRKVEVFNDNTSGFITVSQIDGADFILYAKESLDCTSNGSKWVA